MTDSKSNQPYMPPSRKIFRGVSLRVRLEDIRRIDAAVTATSRHGRSDFMRKAILAQVDKIETESQAKQN